MNNPNFLNSNSLNYDMATIRMPMLQQFSGETSEDVATWITNCKFVLSLFEVQEKTSKKIIFSSLKGKAFDWTQETITHLLETLQSS